MFEGWDSFYILIGSASAALIGLLFVVVTLTSNIDPARANRGASVYMSPSVFHYVVVLMVSALATVPEMGAGVAGVIIGVVATIGLAYAAITSLRIRKGVTPETPHWTDFWYYGVAPIAAYVALAADAATAFVAPGIAAIGVAVTLAALLLVGIRNAWDLITWLAPRREQNSAPPTES